MLVGRKFYAAVMRWRTGFNIPSLSAGGLEVAAGSQLSSYYAPNLILKSAGIRLGISTFSATDETTGILEIPAHTINESHNTGSFQSTAEVTLELDDFAVWNISTGQRLKWSALRFYLDGVLKYTGGAKTLDSPRYAPTGIPLIGVPPTLETSGGFSPEIVAASEADCEDPLDANCVIDHWAKWDYKRTDDGEWVTAPMYVEVPTATMPEDCSCSVDLPESAIISATSVGDCHVRGGSRVVDVCEMIIEGEECDPCGEGSHAEEPKIRNVFAGTRTLHNWGASVMLLPDVEKSVKRWMPSNYREMILRAGFPQVKASATATCGEWGGDTDSNVTTPEVYPEQAAILSNVGNDEHAIEDTLLQRTIAPCTLFRETGQSISYSEETVQEAACVLGGNPGDIFPVCEPLDGTVTCYAAESLVSINEVQNATANPYILPRFDHDDAIVRYIDTVCSPHWSYFVWFPINNIDTDADEIDDSQDQWMVDGGEIPVEYWLHIRQQLGHQDDLPPEEDTYRRMSLPMDPLYTGQLIIAFNDIGVYTNHWGQQNFIALEDQPPTSLAYNASSAALITGTNCSVAFGAGGITVTPDPGETSLIVEIDQGTDALFANFPYGYSFISNEVDLFVESSNVASWEAFWVSLINGATKSITTTNGRFPRQLEFDNGFAFSYKQDYGAGFITDEGADVAAGGESATVMGSASTVHGFELLGGRGAAILRFTIQAENDTDPIVIRWPELFMSAAAPTVVVENGHHQVVAWPDGPAVRIGNVGWVSGGAIAIPPVVYGPGFTTPDYWRASLVDGLCTLKFLSGQDPSDVTAELAAVLLEGEEYTDLDEADGGTISLVVMNPEDATRRYPLTVLVASYRETPPSVAIPMPARDAYKQETGDLAQESWSHAEERVLILANREIHLWDLAGPTKFTELYGAIGGAWKLTGHLQPLTNSEGAFTVRRGATILGETKPWRGFFGIDGRPLEIQAGPSSDVGLDRRHITSYSDGEQVQVLLQDHALNETDETGQGFQADSTCIRIDKKSRPQRFRLYTVESGTVYVRTSIDGGRVFGAAHEIGPGEFVTACISMAGTDFVYRVVDQGDATFDIIGTRYDRRGTVELETEFTVVEEVDNAQIAATVRDISEGVQRVVLRYNVGSVLTIKTSQDGISFS